MKRTLVLATLLILLSMPSWPARAEDVILYAKDARKCFVIEKKNAINQYFVIYECNNCDCETKSKVILGHQSLAEAMRYLERKYGEIYPQKQ